MVKVKKSHSNRTKILIGALVALVIIAGGITVWAISRPAELVNNSDNNLKITPTNTKEQESIVTNNPEQKVVQYEGEDPNTLAELTGSITYQAIEDNYLIISAMIDQYLSEPGTCNLTLSGQNSSKTYQYSVAAVADVSTSICEEFSIPTSELTPDTYQIDIKITGGEKTGHIKGEITF